MSNFFIVNGAVVMCLILYILWRPQPLATRLRLRRSAASHPMSGVNSTTALMEGAQGQISGAGAPRSRSLQVMFNYNGHSWEAYETLGLPPGSSLAQVQSAFEQIALKTDPQSLAFFVAALEAIRESQPN